MVVPTTKSLLSEGLVVASGTVRHPALHPELALEVPGATCHSHNHRLDTDLKATSATNSATRDMGSNTRDGGTATREAEETGAAEETANGSNGSNTDGLSPQLSGVMELQQIMAGSVPDATPPSQNVLGSPPKRDIAKNPVRSKLVVQESQARDGHVGVAIPSSRRKRCTYG